MVSFEGLIVSHYMEPVEMLDQEAVDAFLPDYRPEHVILDPDRPMAVGQILMDDSYYTEYRYQQQEAMDRALEVIPEVDELFAERFGRRYGGLFETEHMEDAEVVLLTLGSMAATVREVVRELRENEGLKIGMVKLRAFRPFPDRDLRECLSGARLIGVLERDVSIGGAGVVYTELCRTLSSMDRGPKMVNYPLGLGGRDVTVDDVRAIAHTVYDEREAAEINKPVRWTQVRGLE
jgi:pyruvate ferredoxin oxidoreductase alpha subunit